jgi:hypothetical protein
MLTSSVRMSALRIMTATLPSPIMALCNNLMASTGQSPAVACSAGAMEKKNTRFLTGAELDREGGWLGLGVFRLPAGEPMRQLGP